MQQLTRMTPKFRAFKLVAHQRLHPTQAKPFSSGAERG
jgi:hypothetical protein